MPCKTEIIVSSTDTPSMSWCDYLAEIPKIVMAAMGVFQKTADKLGWRGSRNNGGLCHRHWFPRRNTFAFAKVLLFLL
jgi:hypothetical protein